MLASEFNFFVEDFCLVLSNVVFHKWGFIFIKTNFSYACRATREVQVCSIYVLVFPFPMWNMVPREGACWKFNSGTLTK